MRTETQERAARPATKTLPKNPPVPATPPAEASPVLVRTGLAWGRIAAAAGAGALTLTAGAVVALRLRRGLPLLPASLLRRLQPSTQR